MNWSKVNQEKKNNQSQKLENRRLLRTKIFQSSNNWNTYRNKNFFIGQRLIERYRPDKGECPMQGIYFNSCSGKFEVWKDSTRIAFVPWKIGQKALIHWASTHMGFEFK